MRSLIWKEWREQSWKLGFSCVVLGAFVLIGLRARIIPDQAMVLGACYIGLGLLPVLTSSGLVPAERNEGSMEMLLSLPISPLRILLVKTVMGVLACGLPLALAAAISVGMAHGREMDTQTMLEVYGRTMLATLALFFWIEALTVRLPTETRAGLLGVGVLLFWGLATAGLEMSRNPWVLALSPLGFLYRTPVTESDYYGQPHIILVPARLIFVILIQACIVVLLWMWAAMRFRAGNGGQAMKQLTTIAWKEWRENSPLLWIALGVFLGLPIIGGVEFLLLGHSHHFEIATEPGVGALGGIFTILVAVGATCRDLHGHVEDFWRSRPVTAVRWMLVKFAVGLAIVFLSLLIPLLAGWLLNRADDEARWMMQTLPAVWCLFYGVGFLAGCLLQRPAHAAVLALSALLLIYFMPAFFAPDNNFGLSKMLIGDYRSAEMILSVLLFAGVLFALAMIAAHFQWRIEPGPKFMHGTIAAAFLIFLFSTGYRLGTNLPVLQQINLDPDEFVETFYMDGSHGYVETYLERRRGGDPRCFRELELTSDGLKLGPRKDAGQHYWLNLSPWAAGLRRGNVEYMASFDDSFAMSLQMVDFTNDPMGVLALKVPLPIRAASERKEPWPLVYLWKDRLYLIGQQLVTVDVSAPLRPKVLSSVRLGYPERHSEDRLSGLPVSRWRDDRTLVYTLPQVPGLPNSERLQVAIKGADWPTKTVTDGKILCQTDGNAVIEFRLEQLTPKEAIFKRIGESDDAGGFFSWGWANGLRLQGDLLYATEPRGDLNPLVKVYATTGPARPRLIGHFAAESSEMFVHPLPDGRAIVAGSKIWLVGPPPHVKN